MSEHWVRTHQRARKEHVCILCHRTIRRGEEYLRGVHFDGSAYSWKECSHCDVFFRYLTHLCGEYEYSEDLPDMWEPETVGQARIKALWRMRWQRKDGSLHPRPRLITEPRESGAYVYMTIVGIALEPAVQDHTDGSGDD